MVGMGVVRVGRFLLVVIWGRGFQAGSAAWNGIGGGGMSVVVLRSWCGRALVVVLLMLGLWNLSCVG